LTTDPDPPFVAIWNDVVAEATFVVRPVPGTYLSVAVTDGFMRDIRCMVVRECVADRTPAVMDASLFDIDQKYGDVVTVADTLSYLNKFPLKN